MVPVCGKVAEEEEEKEKFNYRGSAICGIRSAKCIERFRIRNRSNRYSWKQITAVGKML